MGEAGAQVTLLWGLLSEARAAEEERAPQAPAPALADAPAAGAMQAPAAGGGPGAARAGGLALGVLCRLLTVLKLMYSAGPEAAGDYRLAVVRWRRQAGGRPQGRARQQCEPCRRGRVSWAAHACLSKRQ